MYSFWVFAVCFFISSLSYLSFVFFFFFFFKQKTAYEMRISDWSSDVCSSDLPQVDVYALIPALPVDADPYGTLTGELARAVSDRIPVFADPTGEPVAALPRDHYYDGTTVPVIARQENWVHVLLTGRAALPSAGNPAHLTGWVRAQDVALSSADATVEVDLAGRPNAIVTRDGPRETVGDDYGRGPGATQTPQGRP